METGGAGRQQMAAQTKHLSLAAPKGKQTKKNLTFFEKEKTIKVQLL